MRTLALIVSAVRGLRHSPDPTNAGPPVTIHKTDFGGNLMDWTYGVYRGEELVKTAETKLGARSVARRVRRAQAELQDKGGMSL